MPKLDLEMDDIVLKGSLKKKSKRFKITLWLDNCQREEGGLEDNVNGNYVNLGEFFSSIFRDSPG